MPVQMFTYRYLGVDRAASYPYPLSSDCTSYPHRYGRVRSRQPLVAPSAHLGGGDSDEDDFEEPGDSTVNLDRGRGGRRPSLSKADPAM
ncbi:hypothetical protein BY996DRAFT_6570152, partial [Phakopsora pachyrhizi]